MKNMKLRPLVVCVALNLLLGLTACGVGGAAGGGSSVTVIDQDTTACSVQTPNTTGNMLATQFNPSQEALYRLQDANTCRTALLPKKDARNLGMGELVAQLSSGQYNGTPSPPRTLVLHITPIFWGSNAKGHSEILANDDVLQFVNNGGVQPGRVTKMWLIIVTQYNPCVSCRQYTRTTTTNILAKTGVAVLPGLWVVNQYIDPMREATWVAPQTTKDITSVLI
jgi:hypothetical protein